MVPLFQGDFLLCVLHSFILSLQYPDNQKKTEMKKLMMIIGLLAPLCCFAATETTFTPTEKSMVAEFIGNHIKQVAYSINLFIGILAFFSRSKRYASKNVRFISAVAYGALLMLNGVVCFYYPQVISDACLGAFAFSVIGFVFAWLSKDTPLVGGGRIEEIPLE